MSTTQVADEAQSDTQADEREGRSGAPRPEKVEVVEEVREQLSSNPATLLTEYRGLSVSDLAELRAALREANADYVVVKNTLARIAARDAGFEGLEEFLTGPTALTYCSDDPVGPAKALRRFAKDHPELMVKGGILEGRVVDAETADKLADLESREDLLARLAQLMYGALANTASLLEAPLSKMARLLAAYQEEGDLPEGEAPAEEPEATEDAAPATAVEEPEPADEAEEPVVEEATDEAEATEEPEAAQEVEETQGAEEPAPETADEADEPQAPAEPEETEAVEQDDEAGEPQAAAEPAETEETEETEDVERTDEDDEDGEPQAAAEPAETEETEDVERTDEDDESGPPDETEQPAEAADEDADADEDAQS